MINTLKLSARVKLQSLVLTLQDDQTINHLNKEFVFLLMFAQRFNPLLLYNRFSDTPYYDEKLILLRDIIGWANIITPLEIINVQLIYEIFLYFIGTIHWIVCILCLLQDNKAQFINLVIRKYFTYFQSLLLIPSLINLNHDLMQDTIGSIIILIPIIINTIILLFIQRNYSIPVINPYNKRYNLFNNLIALSDIICLLTLSSTTEYYQTFILLGWYFLQFIDAFVFSPYSYYENLLYVQSSSLLFACAVIKLISFYMDQPNTLYFLLLISPLIGSISMQVFHKISFSILYQDKLTLKQVILITDIQYSKQTPTLATLMIMKSIKSNYQIEISKKESIYYSSQNLIINLFDKLISSKPINQRYSDESLFLYKSLYLIKTCQKQSLGYINLKKYAANTQKQGFFFKIYSEILQEIIQNNQSKQTKQTDASENLQLYDIRQSEILYESSVQLLNTIIDAKIQFWINLLKGYSQIEDLAESVMNLSELIWELQAKIFTKLNLSPSTVSKQLFSLNSLQLKLISFIYSVVLNDYHVTLEIENRIEELMSMERNFNTDLIKNTTLLMDEVIMISTSVIKCRGQILNKNRASLALFFGYENDKDFQTIQYIDQLMPKFTAEIHESCLNNYISSGYSVLFDNSKEVFYQQKSNYIQCSNIQLVHIFENVDDYIVTGALQRVKESQDFIIFDQLGRIVGITKNVFQTLVEQNENEVLVEQIIGKSFIYFWFNQIFEIINDEQKDIFDEDQQNAKIIQKSQLIMPLKNIAKTISENTSYRKIHNWNISLQESKQSKLLDSRESHTNGSQDEEKVLFGIHLLKQSFRDKAKQFIQDINQNEQNNGLVPYFIKYTIQLRLLTPLKVPYFVLQISEITRRSQRPGQTFTTSANYSSIWSNKKQSDILNSDQDDLCVVESNEDNENININQTVINKLGINAIVDQEFKEIEKSTDINYIISPRGNKENLIQKIQDMQDQNEDEDEQKELDQIQQQSSSQKQKKQDIREILQQNKEDEFQNDQEFNKSKTSATSDKTQNSIFNLLKHLQYSQKYQTTIVKAIINTFLLFLTLIILIVAHLMLLRSNTTELKTQIPLVRIPDRFNRLYCTFVTLGQMDLQFKLLNYTYSEYYQHRIRVESQQKRSEILSLISNLKSSFSPFVESGRVQNVKIRLINQFVYEEVYGSMIFFDTMINENTQRVDFYLQTNDIQYVFEEQIALQFLKGNLKSQLQLTNQLIDQIVNTFFQQIDSDQFIYLMLMMIQLLVIFIMIIIQFQFWKDPYLYMQNVLLLISRVPEKDIDILSLKYKSIKEKIMENQNSWKKINYFKDIYNCRISELRKIQKSQKINSITSTQQKKQTTKAKLTSRIQETTFRIWHIYLMLLFLLLLLSGYVISSYMFQYLNSEGSQSELQLCMNFVLFKSDFDSAMILSQLLKNQQILITETMASGVFSRNPQLNTTDNYFKDLYNEMLDLFILTKTSAYISFEQLYNNIVSSTKISSENKILLLGIYQEDLCLYIKETLPFCAYENDKFEYFPDYPPAMSIDNNKEKFKYGINGIVQEIASIFKSYYVKELNGEKDDNLEQVKQFIDSPEYNQIILAYYFDINQAIVQFFVTIIDASLDILETNYQQTQLYYVLFGVVTTILLFFTIGWRSISLQKQIRSVRQALVVLPHENLLDPQIYNSIKRFERNM